MVKFYQIPAVFLILLGVPVWPIQADLVITEIMSRSNHDAPTDCDWWELTNTGPAPVELLGSEQVYSIP